MVHVNEVWCRPCPTNLHSPTHHLHNTRTLLLLCPMQHRYIGQTALHTAFSCGGQVPDVAIPHYKDARMQHSQSRPASTNQLFPGTLHNVSPSPWWRRSRTRELQATFQSMMSGTPRNCAGHPSIQCSFDHFPLHQIC